MVATAVTAASPAPNPHPLAPAPYNSEPVSPPIYNFEYGVSDSYSGANFGHSEKRDNYETSGEYRVNLPDGRTQIVTYSAGPDGYVADVKYEGEAHYDDYKPAPKPAYKSAPKPTYKSAPKLIYKAAPKPVYRPAPLPYKAAPKPVYKPVPIYHSAPAYHKLAPYHSAPYHPTPRYHAAPTYIKPSYTPKKVYSFRPVTETATTSDIEEAKPAEVKKSDD